MFRLFGRDPALGIPNLEGQAQLYTPASTQILFEAVSKAVTDGTPYEIELMTVQPDGEQRPCIAKGFPQRDGNGRVVHIVGLVQDMTEIRRKDEQLRLAASVFTHAREGITITNAEGIIIDVNEAFTRITGYPREEVIGQNPRVLKSGPSGRGVLCSHVAQLDGSWPLGRGNLEPAQKRRGVRRAADHQRGAR
jgi:PAS domain-containing protein